MSFGLELVIVSIGTYLLRRLGSDPAGRRAARPERTPSRCLRLIPAVLSALVANALVLDQGEIRPFGPWYVAAAVAVVVAAREVGRVDPPGRHGCGMDAVGALIRHAPPGACDPNKGDNP